MNRNEAHQLARILQGPTYDGKLIDNLVDAVERAERARGIFTSHLEADPNEGFYRGKIGVVNTQSTAACSALDADNCEHCHAAYGHKAWCPTLNRDVAEAISALNGNASQAEKIRARALGVIL